MQRLILFFSIFLLETAGISAQSNTPSLSERAATSDVIFEGKVIAKEGFWNESHTRIFTKNYVQVSHYLKGNGNDIFELITQGGEVGDVFQELSHGISFEIGQEGMFLCRNFLVEPLGGQNFLMLNGSGGFLGYQLTPTETIVFGHNATYHSLKTEVYPQIGLSEQQIATVTAQPEVLFSGPDNTGQEIEFAFANMTISGISSVEFDVFAKSSASTVKFAGGSIYIQYSTDLFGQSVVANSNITVTKGDIIQNAGYSLGTTDHNMETVKISAEIDCRKPDQMHSLGSTFEKLCHVVVDIANIGVIGSLSMDDFAMNGSVYYYEPETGCVPFEKVIIPEDIDKLLVPVIQTYDTVATAGTGFLLRIKGMDFGTDKGDVVFKNANTGGTSVMLTYQEDIFKWTNDSIIVRVPSNGTAPLGASNQPAGSGIFEVRLPSSSGGATATSPGPLEIRYAVHNHRPNVTNYRTYLGENIDTDGLVDGILTFRLDSLIQFNDSARAGVVTAMCDWSGKTGVQWDLGAVSPKKSFADNDSTNLIFLAPNSLFFGETANATAYTQLTGARVQPCSAPVRFMREVDIVIRRDVTGPPVNAPGGYNFNASALPATNQMDFYSVVAHELGHAHLLRHALPASKIMYPFLPPGQHRKIISVADSDGGTNVLDSSIVKLAPFPTCATAIQKGVGCLATSTKEGIGTIESIILYPNPFEEKVTIVSEGMAEKHLTLFNQLGQILVVKKIEKGIETSEILLGGSIPAGVYFLTIQAEDKISSFKLVKN
ncbi:MAG: T9SS type A sorting domain-containing protein [Cyclobacteriaceae bacterium]|nr:T9SS type A sorting domain-containing protein [Cyclobacteriaceae bacterium]